MKEISSILRISVDYLIDGSRIETKGDNLTMLIELYRLLKSDELKKVALEQIRILTQIRGQ